MVSSRPRSPHWALLSDLARPRRGVLVTLGAVLAVSSALPLAGPQLLRAFIDSAVADRGLGTLLLIAGLYVLLGVVTQVANVATTYVATKSAWSATNEMRERATRHVLGLDLGFHGATTPGVLVERIDGDATAITRFFTDVVVRVIGGVLTLAGALVLVAREDWRAGLVMALFTVATLLLIVRLRDRAVPHTTAERAAYAEVIGRVEEQLDGAADLRALGAGDHALDLHERSSARSLRATVAAERATAWLWSATTGAFAVGGILMLVGGWWLYRTEAVTLGTVFLLFHYTQVVRRPLELIADQLQEVQRAAAGAVRIGQLFSLRPALTFRGTRDLPLGALGVRFEGVDFSYPDDGREVLSSIELAVPPGRVIGLVGQTGSGKTTLARLALRLVDPTAGRVLLGGVDLREVRPAALRERVAIVTQDVQLFDATVRDNLTLFERGHRDEELTDLVSRLGLDGWLRTLPSGLDTVLGPHVGLSAGQAQLLGIGRAFLREPGLVVLDEASSRVDPMTAELVERALDRLLAGKTVLVIAHRLRAVERADEVVVLDGGRVVEHGARTALAADPRSRFHELLRLETEGVGT